MRILASAHSLACAVIGPRPLPYFQAAPAAGQLKIEMWGRLPGFEQDIAEAIDKIADRAPIQANRSLAYTKAFFGWCVGRGFLEANPSAGISKPTRERTRERTPSLDELADIWSAAGVLGYPFGHVVRLLILTAARRDEVGGLRIDELELPAGSDEALWVIPAERSKNGRAIRVPLPPLARQTLASALACRSAAGPFVFSTNDETSVSGWSKAKLRLDREIAVIRSKRGDAAMAPWRFHDLRRSFATNACDVLQIDPAVADRCLNHVGVSTTSTISRVYGRNEMFEQRRDALRKWSAFFGDAVAVGQAPPAS